MAMFELDTNPLPQTKPSNIKRTRSTATTSSNGTSTSTTTINQQKVNLDISKEAIDLLDIIQSTAPQNEKFLIQWQSEQSNINLKQGSKHVERKIIDYFSSLPQFAHDEADCGFLTQACQINALRDNTINDEPDIKKQKIAINERESKKKLLSNLLNEFTEFNRFFTDDQIAPNEHKPQQQQLSPLRPTKQPKLDEKLFVKSPPLSFNPAKLNTETTQRTSTPRGKALFKENQVENEPPATKSISDDSLVIALSQFENKKKPIEQSQKLREPQKRAFNFKPTQTSTTTPDKSFTRYKSDPIKPAYAQPPTKQSTKYFTSSQNIQNDEDDDDDDLLLMDENLLKIIDSKIKSEVPKQAPNHSLAKLMPKKVPIQAAPVQQPSKMIQVPNRPTLKIERNRSTDNFASIKPPVSNQPSKVPPKANFYSTSNQNTTSTSSNQTTSERKYTQDEIEKKRQQALLKLRQKTFSK